MLQKLMNKTIISLLIWLVCMPCMAAAETSKELEDALEKAKKEVSALFDANETEAYINSNRKLMELCLEANDEDLYYKTWSNLATFTFRQNAQKGLKVADEMRDYAKEHDSKIGIITALYTQANMSLKVGMDDRAVKLCNQARSGSSIAIIVSPSAVAVCRYPLHRAPQSLLYYR
jgi:uncharacterized protein YajQ (UPF0234 family)